MQDVFFASRCEYEIPEGIGGSENESDRVLCWVRYGDVEDFPEVARGVLELPVFMTTDDSEFFVEVWKAEGGVSVGAHGDIAVSHDGETLFCAGFIPHQECFAGAVQDAYERAFARIADLGYPNVYRMWNMIGCINDDNRDGLEVYRDFCVGRAAAFESVEFDVARMPAATGIGSRGDGVSFYFLATRSGPVVNIENPRQVPAYEYPRRYGPKSPSFARASMINGSVTLYISGTASILGHRTVHVGDLAGQLETTRDNIRALLLSEPDERPWSLSHLKVYVRHEQDITQVRAFVEEHMPSAIPAVYLNVAICRDDLLFEIEGIATR